MAATHFLSKAGGLSNILGGILVGVAYSLHPHHQTPDVISSDFWLLVHVIFAFSLIFGIFGLQGIFREHAARANMMGFAGFFLATTSLIGIFGLNFYEAFINPVVASHSHEFVERYGAGTTIGHVAWIFPLSGALFLLGYSFLLVDVLRARTLPMRPVMLTMLGTLVFGAGLSGFFAMLVVQIGSALFGAGLTWVGLALWLGKKGGQ